MNKVNSPGSRVVLITGAAKRIGRQIALTMAQRGWDIVIHYGHSATEATNVVAEIAALGRKAVALSCDLSDETQVRQFFSLALAALGRIDCVVNNASLFDADTSSDFTQTKLDQHMHVNVMAPIILAQALHDATDANDQTCVINLLDQKLVNLNPDYLSYTLSKAALQCATTTLAQALAPRVRVVGVAPGLSLMSGDQSDSEFQAAHRLTPLGRSSTPQDIAETVCFIAEARAITGTTILVDGGQHLLPTQRDVMFLTARNSSK